MGVLSWIEDLLLERREMDGMKRAASAFIYFNIVEVRS
jgi:hypothetical protein